MNKYEVVAIVGVVLSLVLGVYFDSFPLFFFLLMPSLMVWMSDWQEK